MLVQYLQGMFPDFALQLLYSLLDLFSSNCESEIGFDIVLCCWCWNSKPELYSCNIICCVSNSTESNSEN